MAPAFNTLSLNCSFLTYLEQESTSAYVCELCQRCRHQFNTLEKLQLGGSVDLQTLDLNSDVPPVPPPTMSGNGSFTSLNFNYC